jgi:F-type H+-transporting ATPase subunit alpha
VSELKDWERDFLEYVAAQYPQVTDTIRKDKVLSKDTETDLKRAIEAFNASRPTGKAAAKSDGSTPQQKR